LRRNRAAVIVVSMQTLNFMPVEVTFKPSGKYWLASCPGLDLMTQGENFERAQENLEEVLKLFIESCLSRGTLEEVLLKAGYTKTRARSSAKSLEEYFSISHSSESECRV
jgi:predicted RNase H-like HicB family nuclease